MHEQIKAKTIFFFYCWTLQSSAQEQPSSTSHTASWRCHRHLIEEAKQHESGQNKHNVCTVWTPVKGTNLALHFLPPHRECSFGSTSLGFFKATIMSTCHQIWTNSGLFCFVCFSLLRVGAVISLSFPKNDANICNKEKKKKSKQRRQKYSHDDFDSLWLTTHNFSHTAGGINTAYVFWMGRVGVIAKQEGCT